METYVDATGFDGSWKEKCFLPSPGKKEGGQIHLAIWTNMKIASGWWVPANPMKC